VSNPPPFLPAIVRAYAVPPRDRATRGQRSDPPRWPAFTLVLDTETTLDATQRLTFGVYQVRHTGALVEEGLIGADDLSPEQWAVLDIYARDHLDERGQRLRVRSRRAFVEEVFWPVALKGRGAIVGFNLPFDLSRLAVAARPARRRFAGGFSLILGDYQDKSGRWKPNPHRPRVAIKPLGDHRAVIGFTSWWKPDAKDRIPEDSPDGTPRKGYRFRGYFVDLHTLARALTDQTFSLASACRAFQTPYGKDDHRPTGRVTLDEVDYCRHDVRATWELYWALRAEYEHHPLKLSADRAYSTASIGKAYLKAMGVQLPAVHVCPAVGRSVDAVRGLAMTTYYGGRAECHVRTVPVPVVYCDFLSMYPTVNTLMGLWRFLTAERIVVEDATDEVCRFVDGLSADDLFRPETWTHLPALVEVLPDADVLPLRTTYDSTGKTFQIGVNPVTSDRPLWYTLADVIASAVLTGRAPVILRALRFRPEGRQAGLRPVKLRGTIPVDPRTGDFFQTVIEERQRRKQSDPTGQHFLKILANSTAYGIFVELNRQEDTAADVAVFGLDHFTCHVDHVEEPGRFFFPILGTLITGAARLMLALAEAEVTRHGGTYAMMDTDSLAIVASEHGGLIPCPGGPERLPDGRAAMRALSWDEVQAVVERFAALNPYDRSVVPGSVLKVEDENFARDPDDPQGKRVMRDRREQLYCVAISAKRYALFNVDGDGEPVLRKWSDHGLGHLLPPWPRKRDGAPNDDWIHQVWAMIVRESLELAVAKPDWLTQPILTRLSISTPTMREWFTGWNGKKPYAGRIKPYNFLLVAHVAPLGHPVGADPERFILIAPHTDDTRRWRSLSWINRYDGQRYRVETAAADRDPQAAVLQTFGAYLRQFRHHPEAKSAGADGRPCERQTVGLLQRREVRIGYVVHVGKEANKLEQVEAGIVGDQDEVYTVYEDSWEDVRFALERMPVKDLVHQTGLSRMGLYKLRSGLARPRDEHRATLQSIAAAWVRGQLGASVAEPAIATLTDREALAAYRHCVEKDERRLNGARETARARREWRRELFTAIRALGGIRRHRDGDLREEYRQIPRSLRSSRGMPPDEMAAMLAEHYPWLGIGSENELYSAFEREGR
jgi:hypothetical protein